jgi:hypothetical protein
MQDMPQPLGFYARLELLKADMIDRAHQTPEIVAGANWRRAARTPVLVRAIPGFADLWTQKVPEDSIERASGLLWVRSPCGERVQLAVGEVTFCPDDCGRWLLRLEDGTVRVKRWPREVAAEAA